MSGFLRGLQTAPCFRWLGLDLGLIPIRPRRQCQPRKRETLDVLNRLWRAAAAAAGIAGATSAVTAQTRGTIKIGVLHSLSGTMAISEATLKDTIL
jgi:hypothetical protein